ncbi:6289_t:CDS:2 [Gigaspora margarita]|uniref:6289_t:CDS:1 n=1 Tax=Gigaspora margarita TaxID=4874 RepID=A0ABN7UJU8_GIGMA|nr:6289_t:CDS:2 [Gigaspora margarita]
MLNLKHLILQRELPVLKLTGNFGDSGPLIFDKDNRVLERASKFYKIEFELMKVSLTISGQLGGFTKLDLVQVKSKYAREFNDISSKKKKIEIGRSVEVVSLYAVENISDEIIPISTFQKNVEQDDAFINHLVPGISNMHNELIFKDWISVLPSADLLTWKPSENVDVEQGCHA